MEPAQPQGFMGAVRDLRRTIAHSPISMSGWEGTQKEQEAQEGFFLLCFLRILCSSVFTYERNSWLWTRAEYR